MAMNHIAIANRSSSRVAQKHNESQPTNDPVPSSSFSDIDLVTESLSVISVSSNDGDELIRSTSRGGQSRDRKTSESSQTSRSRLRTLNPIRPPMPPLEKFTSVSDIERCIDNDYDQKDVINQLGDRWVDMMENLNDVLDHLKECSDEVTIASNDCLNSLSDSIELTCDSVDGQVKALYHLMTKCDELTTKLSAASSFRDEVKTLRKSVETLEILFKSKPSLGRTPMEG